MLTDNLRSFISWGIRKHTHGNYSHIGLIVHPKMFASQLTTFREVPVEKYMKRYYRLKFYGLKANEETKQLIIQRVEKILSLPFYKRIYDYLGILGQFLRFRKLQNPFAYYCSEIITDILEPFHKFPPRRTPSELNRLMANSPKFKYLGHFFID